MYDVITIGAATRDVFLINTPFHISPSRVSPTGFWASLPLGAKIEMSDVNFETGGGATNAAATFSHLGLKTGVFSRVGNDPSGREIATSLERFGADTSLFQISKTERTAYSVILLTKKGERTILVYRGASAFPANFKPNFKKLQARWWYLTSLGGNKKLLADIFFAAKKMNVNVAWNPGSLELKLGLKILKPLLNQARIVLLNHDEAAALTRKPSSNESAIRAALEKHLKTLTVVTKGVCGADVLAPDLALHADALPVRVVNATGAGDAFGSAFTAGYMKTGDPEIALRLGILNSGGVVSAMGAKTGILEAMPSVKELTRVKIQTF